MRRRIFRTGNSIAVAVPRQALDALHLGAGSEVEVELDRETGRIVISPVEPQELAGVDQEFARQVSEFIEQYRPALERLAGK